MLIGQTGVGADWSAGGWTPACFAADFIIAVKTSEEPWGTAPFITDHLHRKLLQPSNERLHESELDQPPDTPQHTWHEHTHTHTNVTLTSGVETVLRKCCQWRWPLIDPLKLLRVARTKVPYRGSRTQTTVELEHVSQTGLLLTWHTKTNNYSETNISEQTNTKITLSRHLKSSSPCLVT